MKYVIASMLALCMVGLVYGQANPPPANGGYAGGWGMNPTNWETTSGAMDPTWGIYNPVVGLGGGGWVVGWGDPLTYITYSPITIELWVELYALQSYRFTSYKFHRTGDSEEPLCWTIQGLIAQNHNSWVMLTKGANPLTHLKFNNGVVGGNAGDPPADLPITWTTRWGNGIEFGLDIVANWFPAPWSGDDIGYRIPKCDHWFEFKGCVGDMYHVSDGYYSLQIAGCPAPEL